MKRHRQEPSRVTRSAKVLILTEPELMNGERFELRVSFEFEHGKLRNAVLSKVVGQPGLSRPADLDPIDFKIAKGCLENEEKHLIGRPGFRRYEDIADPELRFIIDVNAAVNFVRLQEVRFLEKSKESRDLGDREEEQEQENTRDPLSPERREPNGAEVRSLSRTDRSELVGDIDALLGEVAEFGREITSRELPRHQ